MNASLPQLLFSLLAGILLIIILTARYKMPAFFALLLACFVTGLSAQLPFMVVLDNIKDGFGNIMKSLALIIVLGTTLGVALENSGSTKVMAGYILKKTGEKNAAWAISITGFIVGMPVFCDSGYIVLSGLTKSMAKRSGLPVVVMSVSLATGLYAVHCMIPPHPGATAAAAAIGVDPGKLILYGIIIALPAMVAGHYWARFAGKKSTEIVAENEELETEILPGLSPLKAFLPVVVPIFLIAVKSFLLFTSASSGFARALLILGDPVIALLIGAILAFNNLAHKNRKTINILLQNAIEKAGGILIIIGAGGAFGAVLAATKPGDHFSAITALKSWGLFFPFLICFLLKTAQGSSTVAIITSASIVQPLLPLLHLDNNTGHLLAVLAMGAGSMMISHANDAYFWVITRFSGLEMRTILKVYSIASVVMGVTALLSVYILSLIL